MEPERNRRIMENGGREAEDLTQGLLFRLTPNVVKASFLGHWDEVASQEVVEPLLAAVVNRKVVIYGQSVLELKALGEDKKKIHSSWDVGEILVSNTFVQQVLLEFESERKVVPVEFLLGFIFSSVRRDLEERNDSKEWARKVVIIVPLWFGSPHRKRVKDAALIAGFKEVTLVNETTAVAFTFINENLGLSCGKDLKRFLVITENSGHVDVAQYEYNSVTEQLQMISCSGSAYLKKTGPESLARQVFKKRYYETSKCHSFQTKALPDKHWLKTEHIPDVDRTVEVQLKIRKSLVATLITEVIGDNGASEIVVVHCEDWLWHDAIDTLEALDFEQNSSRYLLESEDAQMKPFDFQIKWLDNINITSNQTSFEDLMPHNFSWKEDTIKIPGVDSVSFTTNILPGASKAYRGNLAIASLSGYTWPTSVHLLQERSDGNDVTLGLLVFPKRICYIFPRGLEITFVVDEEAIIELEGVQGFKDGIGISLDDKHNKDYTWYPTSLSEDNRRKFEVMMTEFEEFNRNQERKLLEVKEAVEKVFGTMMTLIRSGSRPKGMPSRILNLVKKDIPPILEGLEEAKPFKVGVLMNQINRMMKLCKSYCREDNRGES